MSKRAWIAASIAELNAVGSWTGRTHVHKHLFIANVLELTNVPFDFELYHFGPYSFEIDERVAEMEVFGEVEKEYTKPGYGPKYSATFLAHSDLSENQLDALRRVAESIRNYNSNDLELIATCLWMQRIEGESDDRTIVDRVKEIKPKYSASRIQLALDQARKLASELG